MRIMTDADLRRIFLCPRRVSVGNGAPALVVGHSLVVDQLLSLQPRQLCVLQIVEAAQEVLFLLEYNLGHKLALDQIHTLHAGGIVSGHFFAFEHIHTGTGHMGQVTMQGLLMFFFPASAAAGIAVHQVIIANIHLIAARAPAMPYHAAAGIAVRQVIFRRQPVERLPGDIHKGIVFFGIAAAAGFTSGIQQRPGDHALLSARAPAHPAGTAIGGFLGGFRHHGQLTERFIQQIQPCFLAGAFAGEAPAAHAAAILEASLQHAAFCTALTAAQPTVLAVLGGRIGADKRPPSGLIANFHNAPRRLP